MSGMLMRPRHSKWSWKSGEEGFCEIIIEEEVPFCGKSYCFPRDPGFVITLVNLTS